MKKELIAVIVLFVIAIIVEFFYIVPLSIYGLITQKTGDLIFLTTGIVFLVVYIVVWQFSKIKAKIEKD
jgi:hypothetical protein